MTAEPEPPSTAELPGSPEAAVKPTSPAGDASRQEPGTRAPNPFALVTVEVAALFLPERYRARYCREFLAELYEMKPREQLEFAACVLGQAWHLRAVLRDLPPLDDEGC